MGWVEKILVNFIFNRKDIELKQVDVAGGRWKFSSSQILCSIYGT